MVTTEISIGDVFSGLTPRQHEAMALLAEGRTSKEIAHQLGISESAAIQRIEAVRAKSGGLLRKDLARKYRSYLQIAETGHAPRVAHDPAGMAGLGVRPSICDDLQFADFEARGQAFDAARAEPCNDLTGNFFQLLQDEPRGQFDGRNQAVEELVLADAIPFEITSPWASRSEPAVVPKVLDGTGAALNRMLAVAALTGGMLVVLLVLLAVAGEIGELV